MSGSGNDFAPKCSECGEVITGDVFTLHFSSLGTKWEEKLCKHCYVLEKDSIPMPCSNDCDKCNKIKNKPLSGRLLH